MDPVAYATQKHHKEGSKYAVDKKDSTNTEEQERKYPQFLAYINENKVVNMIFD